jgi:hypothetical protein
MATSWRRLLTKAFRKAAIDTAGSYFGLPSTQINRSWTGIEAMAEGRR